MADSAVTVREAQPQEFRLIAQFVWEMARETEGLELDPETVEAAVQTALSDPDKGVYYVAEADEGLIGQALVTREWSDWNCCEYWWLQSIYVVPQWRRRGVFSSIYRHIRDRAHDASAAALRLYVLESNMPAVAAYRRLGMTDTGYIVMEDRCASRE
jgi:GNAT superfamily N-acetyltransferase